MAIDLSVEHPLTFQEAGRPLPRQPNLSTWHRWRLRGVRGVRLETVVVGGRRYTTAEAVSRFIAATTAAANREPVPIHTPRQQKVEQSRVDAGLRQRGLLSAQ
jgi:hypothetical protein